MRVLACLFLMMGMARAQIIDLPPPNPHFVGRIDELKHIKQALSKQPCFIVTGGPGFGKTQLANRYAHQVVKDYDVISWIEADQV